MKMKMEMKLLWDLTNSQSLRLKVANMIVEDLKNGIQVIRLSPKNTENLTEEMVENQWGN